MTLKSILSPATGGNRLARAIAALPIVGEWLWAMSHMHGGGLFKGLILYLEEPIKSGRIKFGSINIPILDSFHGSKAIDDLWRLAIVAFAPSTLEIDPVSWFQMVTFITDLGVIYSIWLFESTRKVNKWTPAQMPIVFGFLAQQFGIGSSAPIYYFLYYINTPLTNLRNPALRTTDPIHRRSIFFTMTIFHYIPFFTMYLGSTPTIRHWWTWAWQMFPVWISIAQLIQAQLHLSLKPCPNRRSAPNNEIANIRYTIGIFAAVSAIVWIYTLTLSPFLASTILIPQSVIEPGFLPAMRRWLQYDHISGLGSSLIWVLYLFAELKSAGLVKQGWPRILGLGSLATVCFGPGFTLAVGWLWREEVLVRESWDEKDL